MIVFKTWEKYASANGGLGARFQHIDHYQGWFLFGIIPLYIKRERHFR